MNEAKFKIGDIVRIIGYQYGITQMRELFGKIVKIDGLIGKNWYRAAGWGWQENWLESAYESMRNPMETML